MKRDKAIDIVSDDHVLALDAFIAKVGARWRKPLNTAWESGNYPPDTESPAVLTQIRDKHGSALILKLRTVEVQETAKAVRLARLMI